MPSLLDPNIKSLQPVLRSNYWLTIHVLTEVSSYAAFALAMGLGLIATLYYLTATYRHSVRYSHLAVPLIPGLPMLILGGIGVVASSIRVTHFVGVSRKYQVRGQDASPATVTTGSPGATLPRAISTCSSARVRSRVVCT